MNTEKFLALLYLQVCSWGDKQMLRSITWKDATDLTGCYAFNAAQDGGQCKPCTSHVEQVGTAPPPPPPPPDRVLYFQCCTGWWAV